MAYIRRVSLSNQGLSCMSFIKDFKLYIADELIECSKGQIAFLSPHISNLLFTDPTIDEYHIESTSNTHCIEYFRQLINGNVSLVASEDDTSFFNICLELGNQELSHLIIESIPMDVSNVLKRIYMKQMLNHNFEDEIEFVAESFYMLSKDEMKDLPIEIIELILSSENLVATNESEILNFIESVDDPDHHLMRCLRLEYLPRRELLRALDIFESLDDESKLSVWPRIISCIKTSSPLVPKLLPKKVLPAFNIQINPGAPKFRGVIHFLLSSSKNDLSSIGVQIERRYIVNDLYSPSGKTNRPEVDGLVWKACPAHYLELSINLGGLKILFEGMESESHSQNENINPNSLCTFIRIIGSNDNCSWDEVTHVSPRFSKENNILSLYSPTKKYFSDVPYRYIKILYYGKPEAHPTLRRFEIYGGLIVI